MKALSKMETPNIFHFKNIYHFKKDTANDDRSITECCDSLSIITIITRCNKNYKNVCN